MKKITLFSLIYLLSVSIILAQNTSPALAQGGGEYVFETQEKCLSDEERTNIIATLKENVKRLQAEGKLPLQPSEDIVSFDWPMQKAPSLDYYDYYGISNYVDQNTGSALLDYNCDARTYDGHKGTDYFTWPFPWYLYENNLIEVVAAEAGTIINKSDNNADDHCSCSGSWNAVYVQHSDGSIAWYGHLKTNSLTSKSVGQTVSTGEYLGVVASSGCSTGPHLHFEIYDGNSNLIDPYAGNCNSLNGSSWWANQLPNRSSTVNAVLTHSDVPIHGCPGGDEEPYLLNHFNPGQTLYTAFYYHDQLFGDLSNYTIRLPNNAVWNSWTHTANNTFNSSWWWWSWTIPNNAPFGTWTVEAQYKGQTFVHEFTVSNTTTTEDVSLDHQIQLFPNPNNGRVNIKGLNNEKAIIKVMDSRGRLLSESINKNQTINLTALPNGLYFVQIEVNEQVVTKRMVKI